METEQDLRLLEEAERNLLEKANNKPKPTSVNSEGSLLTKEDVKNIVAKKIEKLEKKQVEFAASVGKNRTIFKNSLRKCLLILQK